MFILHLKQQRRGRIGGKEGMGWWRGVGVEERAGLLLWNDINVQKWFHMQCLSGGGLGRPNTGPAPGK